MSAQPGNNKNPGQNAADDSHRTIAGDRAQGTEAGQDSNRKKPSEHKRNQASKDSKRESARSDSNRKEKPMAKKMKRDEELYNKLIKKGVDCKKAEELSDEEVDDEDGDDDVAKGMKLLDVAVDLCKAGTNLFTKADVDAIRAEAETERAADMATIGAQLVKLRERISNMEKAVVGSHDMIKGLFSAVDDNSEILTKANKLLSEQGEVLVKAQTALNTMVKAEPVAASTTPAAEATPAEDLKKAAPLADNKPVTEPQAVVVASPLDGAAAATDKKGVSTSDLMKKAADLLEQHKDNPAMVKALRSARTDMVSGVNINQILQMHGKVLGVSVAG